MAGLNAWIPCFSLGSQYHPGDTYNFRSLLASGVVFELCMYEDSPLPEDYPYEWHRRMLVEYHRAKQFLSGDYYELTQQTLSRRQWQVLQFDRPDLAGGCVVALRRSDSPFKSAQFALRGLEPNAFYEIEDADSGALRTLSGRELLEHALEIELPIRRSSMLLFYTRVKESTEHTE